MKWLVMIGEEGDIGWTIFSGEGIPAIVPFISGDANFVKL